MKNTYIIAIEKDGMPMFIKQKPMECICYIGRYYQNAYIFNSKKEAEKTRAEWFENWRIEKQKFTK